MEITMSVTGNWSVTMKSPMGAQDATLSLVDDNGVLSGSMAGPQGEQAFSGGSVDGDAIAAAHAAAQQLDNDHPRDVLEALVANGGLNPESGVSEVDPEQESQS